MQNINIKNIIIIQSYVNLQNFYVNQKLSAEKRLHVGTGPSSCGQPGESDGEDEEAKLILLMEDIPNNHLGCFGNLVNDGINYQPQLVISSINSTTCVAGDHPWSPNGHLKKSCQILEI